MPLLKDPMNRRRGMLQIASGIVQVFAATVAAILIWRTGVNELSVGATLVAALLAVASRYIFGRMQ
jgi:hypothetical protein